MKIKLLPCIVLAFYMATATITFAQRGKLRRHPGNQEMQQEMKAYVQQNITPVMQQQRLKLEKKLSSADKKQIRELRNRMAANRQQIQDFRKSLSPQRQQVRKDMTEEQKTRLQQQRVERRNIRSEAIALAHKYDATIQALFKEVAIPAEAWQKDLRTIAQKHNNLTPPLNPNDTRGKEQSICRMQSERGIIKYLRPVPFLLWDVNKPLPGEETNLQNETRLFPNPVAADATLEYALKEGGKVTIDLLDAQGKVIRNLRKTNQAPGSSHLKLELPELKKGLYFLNITSPAGTETIRFLKN